MERPGTAVASPAPPSSADAGSAKPDEPSYTAEEYARFRRHLHLGRAHADQRRYSEAVREFDRALDVLPEDGLALSELGWAAFLAGDWQRARTANQAAVRAARKPKVKAASLYNLGRLAEAMGDRAEAEARYRESLKLRENAAVGKRLKGLASSRPASLPSTRSECPASADVAALCACLAREVAGAPPAGSTPVPEGASAAPSACQNESRDVAGVELLFVGDDNEEWVHLIRKHRNTWSSIARLGRVYDADADGVHEEFEVARFENRQLGERRVLWIEVAQTRTDEQARARGQLAEREQRLVVCPWPADGQGGLTCVLEVPVSKRRERAQRRGKKPADDARPHVTTVFAVDVNIGDDGRARVVLSGGKRTAALAPILGEHQLW